MELVKFPSDGKVPLVFLLQAQSPIYFSRLYVSKGSLFIESAPQAPTASGFLTPFLYFILTHMQNI